jgi:hypothetical protein
MVDLTRLIEVMDTLVPKRMNPSGKPSKAQVLGVSVCVCMKYEMPKRIGPTMADGELKEQIKNM